MRGNELMIALSGTYRTKGVATAVLAEADVLACPECGGRLRLLATIAQREVIEKILSHLGLPTQPVPPAPAAIEVDLFGGVARYTH